MTPNPEAVHRRYHRLKRANRRRFHQVMHLGRMHPDRLAYDLWHAAVCRPVDARLWALMMRTGQGGTL